VAEVVAVVGAAFRVRGGVVIPLVIPPDATPQNTAEQSRIRRTTHLTLSSNDATTRDGVDGRGSTSNPVQCKD
jgi:hypothetical protein